MTSFPEAIHEYYFMGITDVHITANIWEIHDRLQQHKIITRRTAHRYSSAHTEHNERAGGTHHKRQRPGQVAQVARVVEVHRALGAERGELERRETASCAHRTAQVLEAEDHAQHRRERRLCEGRAHGRVELAARQRVRARGAARVDHERVREVRRLGGNVSQHAWGEKGRGRTSR